MAHTNTINYLHESSHAVLMIASKSLLVKSARIAKVQYLRINNLIV